MKQHCENQFAANAIHIQQRHTTMDPQITFLLRIRASSNSQVPYVISRFHFSMISSRHIYKMETVVNKRMWVIHIAVYVLLDAKYYQMSSG